MLPGPGLYLTFLYYFSSVTLIVAIVAIKGLNLNPSTGLPLELGMLMGLIAGGIGTYFKRTLCVSIPVANSQKTLNQLQEILTSMGYEKTDLLDDYDAYVRSGPSGFFSGKIFVQTTAEGVTIAGRASQVRQLRQQLEPTSTVQ